MLASNGNGGTILLWNLQTDVKRKIQEVKWTDDDRRQLWHDLMDADAVRAYAAMMRLKQSPTQTVALFRDRLRQHEKKEQIERWVADLNSEIFATRKKASDALVEVGERARPLLLAALAAPKSLEHKRHIEVLLDKLSQPLTTPRALRHSRAIEVLEACRTPEAAALLRQLADESP